MASRFERGVVAVETTEPAQTTACYEYNCPSPMKAGLRLYNGSGYDGMSGFVFRYTDGSGYLISTAGHTSVLNESKYHPSGTYRGKVYWDVDGMGAEIDAALITISAPRQGTNSTTTTDLAG